jgi:hypothetical protein
MPQVWTSIGKQLVCSDGGPRERKDHNIATGQDRNNSPRKDVVAEMKP